MTLFSTTSFSILDGPISRILEIAAPALLRRSANRVNWCEREVRTDSDTNTAVKTGIHHTVLESVRF